MMDEPIRANGPDDDPVPAACHAAGNGPEAGRSRMNRLAAIRSMIDSGTYETDERWEGALARLLVEIDG